MILVRCKRGRTANIDHTSLPLCDDQTLNILSPQTSLVSLYKMSFAGAVGKVKTELCKSIWDVDYSNMSDRIEARRDRIRKRIEAAKRLTKLMKIQKLMGFKGDVEEDEEIVKTTAEQSNLNIHNLNNFGEELVTNVKLAGEFLQVEHRNHVEKKNEKIQQILEDEDSEMRKKFDEILKTWPSLGDKMKGSPTQLFEDILAVKEMCNDVLRSKNQLIEMLEGENRLVDESYKGLIQEYHTNISVLSGRMEYHVHSFESMLESERTRLVESYDQQKSQQLKKGENSWQALLEGAARSSKDQMESRLGLVVEQEKEMDELIVNDYEQLGETKQSMEWNVRCLEEQIEMIQAITHLNTERLDYEIHVLNKHEEENAIIKSEQKRKITVLQDSANKLKSKVKDTEKHIEKEKGQLADSVKLIKKQIKELEEKQKKFGAQSAKTREDMTRMMRNEAYDLLDKITENDKLLHRFYLNKPFKERSESKLSKDKLLSRLSSTQDSLHSEGSRRSSQPRSRRSKSSSSEISPEEEKRNLKRMLLTLIEKADFLVEDDLNALMAVLPDKDKLLLKVDSILGALGVREERDIEKIFTHLTKNSDTGDGGENSADISTEIVTTAEKRSKILKILREYVEEPESAVRNQETRKAVYSTFDILKSVTGSIKPDKEGQMWDELKEAIQDFKSPDRAHLKTLLAEYKDILLARADLMKRNRTLKSENTQLKQLLKNYLEQEQ